MELANKNVCVIGLGITGYYTAKWLASIGAKVTVTDKKDPKELDSETLQELKNLGITLELGFHKTSTILNSDVIIPSPGVPLDIEPMALARKKNILILGELDILSRYLNAKIIAITGTNGKSTVTTLIGELLLATGQDVFVGGNLGTPPVKLILEKKTPRYLVLEISSFQLDLSRTFSPDIAILLNITPDHLDRYNSFEDYIKSKFSIFNNQTSDQYAILNLDDPVIAANKIHTQARLLFYSITQSKDVCAFISGNKIVTSPPLPSCEISVSGYKLLGTHNLSNLLSVVITGLLLGLDKPFIERAISTFRSLPHRFEYIGTFNNRIFIDDSKATNVDATVKAVSSLNQDMVLILGGRHKGADYAPIVEAAKGKIRHAILLGEAKELIAKALEGNLPYSMADTMEMAVKMAYEISLPGDAILLSPACSSFDMFRDYKHRGEEFKRAMEKLR